MANIIKSNPEPESIEQQTATEEHSIELTDAKRRQIHNEATALFADSVAMGVRLFIQRSAALHNIKTFQTYRLEGYNSWSSYCEANGISRQYSYKYLGIARALVGQIEGAEPEQFLFTRQHIESLYKDSSQAFRQLPFNDLFKLSERLDVFTDAMNGVELVKLLPAATGDATATPEAVERKEKSDLQQTHDHMAAVCKENGWKWNRKLMRCEYPDGTPISDEDRGRITIPHSALRVWKDTERTFLYALNKATDSILQAGPVYLHYARITRNDEVTSMINELRERMRREYQAFELMLDNLYAAEADAEKRLKEIKKHGIEA